MKNISLAAASLAFIGVALGAFGAHILRDSLEARAMLEVWRTAVFYHLLHAVAAWTLAQRTNAPSPWLYRAGWAWLSGVGLFSGSLYLLALGGPKWLGPVTPLGGFALMFGWLCAILASRSASDSSAA